MGADFESLRHNGWRVVIRPVGSFARRRGKVVFCEQIKERLHASLSAQTGGCCTYCGERMERSDASSPGLPHKPRANVQTIEHRLPISRGGTWKRNNLIASCYRCNKWKGTLGDEEFRAVFAEFADVSDKMHRLKKVAARARDLNRKVDAARRQIDL